MGHLLGDPRLLFFFQGPMEKLGEEKIPHCKRYEICTSNTCARYLDIDCTQIILHFYYVHSEDLSLLRMDKH